MSPVIPRRTRVLAAAAAAAMVALAGCSSQQGMSGGDPHTLELWTHVGGNEPELSVIRAAAEEYMANSDVTINITEFPQRSYNEAIVGAASSGDLPCLFDLDGPIMPNWAWSGYLAPLDLPADTTDTLLESARGEWNGTLYSVGAFDTSLTILARKSALVDNGIRIPDVDHPWTKAEFDAALEKLSKDPHYDRAIDMSVWDSGEWWSYAYSPMLQSFGGDLINRDTYLSADGALNGPEAIAFGKWFQDLFAKGYASKTPSQDGIDFTKGKAALMYTGGWKVDQAQEALGTDEVLILPPVDFGHGPKVGGGSWQWGVSATCANKPAANGFIATLLQDKYLVKVSDNSGNFPARERANKYTKNFAPGAPMEPLFPIAEKYSMIRPPTPGYAVISSVFDKAMHDIMAGADVKSSLDQAVVDIDANIKANDGYGMKKK
ncbi:extracellular solute-binding protein [Nanchangia anserum]|uniref:Extracellular solute-binding protein n=1 Tax=Nanchangia anserum TaxID=2692125 RepID=A0A8I0KVN9_9ACTO|nr:extracellular solute-binding protein [Nanchangia anserum]MBD3689139.1 extracellular solute-binding protein [Nanchangia anserum]QOX81373.1 extracellular solute-binding protein [Nanchangia anserum]